MLSLDALFVFALRSRTRASKESILHLRHTISVNLDILDSELVELNAIVTKAQPSAAREEASRLLQRAQSVATSARACMYTASSYELQETLGHVFAAMMHSTEARRLLNAQRPRSK